MAGDGAPQPKKLLSFEEPTGDLIGDLGGDFGNGLLRLERLDALSGGLLTVGDDVCWTSVSMCSSASCGEIDFRPNIDMILREL